MSPEALYKNLTNELKKYKTDNLSRVDKAYRMAFDAHKSQKRKNGEPYIVHPIAVAIILAELRLDTETIIAGLLHDVIEDTHYTYEDIQENFSTEVADLVQGVTKLLQQQVGYAKGSNEKTADEKQLIKQKIQAETYRKMFVSMAKDIRVIIIKIADRLHNMRTLDYMSAEKQKQKAQETLDIYAPLALRMGIGKIRNELEDLCLKYLKPDIYHSLSEKIHQKQTLRQKLVDEMVEDLRKLIQGYDLPNKIENFSIEGRPKHFFSIYKKMLNKNVEIEEIYDLFAVRIMVDTSIQCYEVLGIIHDAYTPIHQRFKDYISLPKSNHYQSIHTTIMGVRGEPFEIQIRTYEMHQIAEHGIAAHWKYKEAPNTKVSSEDERYNHLRKMLDWQRNLTEAIDDDDEYIKELKTDLDIYKSSIYCYTPQGDIIELKEDSTPVDFAYAIHSAVGNTMVGAKVNSAMVPFEHKLKMGDRVEIVTSRNSTGPKAEWLNFVQTSQARNRIRNWLKKETKGEYLIKGTELLEAEAVKRKVDLQELLTEESKSYLLHRYNYIDWDGFVAAVGRRSIKEEQVLQRLIDEKEKLDERTKKLKLLNLNLSDATDELAELVKINPYKNRKKSKSGVIVQGLGGVEARFSKCCTPLPGDEIIGFITRGRGVSVHRTDCKNIIHLSNDDKNRLIETVWDIGLEKTVKYSVDLMIDGADRAGLIVDISTLLLNDKIYVKNLHARPLHDNKALINLTVEIDSKEQLDRISGKILSLKDVHAIRR